MDVHVRLVLRDDIFGGGAESPARVVARDRDGEFEVLRRARLLVFVLVRAALAGIARGLGAIARGVEALGGAVRAFPAVAVDVIAAALGKGGKIEGTEGVV